MSLINKFSFGRRTAREALRVGKKIAKGKTPSPGRKHYADMARKLKSKG